MQPPPLLSPVILPFSGSISTLNIYSYQCCFDKFLAIAIVTVPYPGPECNYLSLVSDCGSLNLGDPDSGRDVSEYT